MNDDLTLDRLVTLVRACKPARPEIRPSPYLPRGQAYRIRIPVEFRRRNDPPEIIIVNDEDYKHILGEEASS